MPIQIIPQGPSLAALLGGGIGAGVETGAKFGLQQMVAQQKAQQAQQSKLVQGMNKELSNRLAYVWKDLPIEQKTQYETLAKQLVSQGMPIEQATLKIDKLIKGQKEPEPLPFKERLAASREKHGTLADLFKGERKSYKEKLQESRERHGTLMDHLLEKSGRGPFARGVMGTEMGKAQAIAAGIPYSEYKKATELPAGSTVWDKIKHAAGGLLGKTPAMAGGAAAGAALGGAVASPTIAGTPIGGAIGGAAGMFAAPAMLDTALEEYMQYKERGGKGSFEGFIKSAAKVGEEGLYHGAMGAMMLMLGKLLPELKAASPAAKKFFEASRLPVVKELMGKTAIETTGLVGAEAIAKREKPTLENVVTTFGQVFGFNLFHALPGLKRSVADRVAKSGADPADVAEKVKVKFEEMGGTEEGLKGKKAKDISLLNRAVNDITKEVSVEGGIGELSTKQKASRENTLRNAKRFGVPVNKDGTITLYHGTRSGNAIRKSGKIENYPFFTTSKKEAFAFGESKGGKGKAEVIELNLLPHEINLGGGPETTTYGTSINESIPLRKEIKVSPEVAKATKVAKVAKEAPKAEVGKESLEKAEVGRKEYAEAIGGEPVYEYITKPKMTKKEKALFQERASTESKIKSLESEITKYQKEVDRLRDFKGRQRTKQREKSQKLLENLVEQRTKSLKEAQERLGQIGKEIKEAAPKPSKKMTPEEAKAYLERHMKELKEMSEDPKGKVAEEWNKKFERDQKYQKQHEEMMKRGKIPGAEYVGENIKILDRYFNEYKALERLVNERLKTAKGKDKAMLARLKKNIETNSKINRNKRAVFERYRSVKEAVRKPFIAKMLQDMGINLGRHERVIFEAKKVLGQTEAKAKEAWEKYQENPSRENLKDAAEQSGMDGDKTAEAVDDMEEAIKSDDSKASEEKTKDAANNLKQASKKTAWQKFTSIPRVVSAVLNRMGIPITPEITRALMLLAGGSSFTTLRGVIRIAKKQYNIEQLRIMRKRKDYNGIEAKYRRHMSGGGTQATWDKWRQAAS